MSNSISTVKCFECDSTNNVHQHHIVPKSMGGTKTIPLCGYCHGLVHGKNFGMEWKRLQMEGIRKRKELGLYKGRGLGSSESIGKFMNKPKNQQIMELLNMGLSYIEIQNKFKCSPNLILKVRKLSTIPKHLWDNPTKHYM